jgi:hypothetical protein
VTPAPDSTNREGLRTARQLLDQYETSWRGRIALMTEMITDSETDLRSNMAKDVARRE